MSSDLTKLKIDILTLFPKMFKGPFDESIIRRAIDKNLVEIKIHNLRDWAKDKHKTVDDRPYGGGVGMILKPEPIFEAVEQLRGRRSEVRDQKTILLSPQGKRFDQRKAEELAKLKYLIFICGRYEGVDERVREHLIDEEISIGDYVLTGGEIPAMVLVDTIVRLIPGVLEKPEALENESFQLQASSFKLLEFPQYTRPENFRGYKIPEVLLSGDHKKIAQWRQKQSLLKTRKNRPDLLK